MVMAKVWQCCTATERALVVAGAAMACYELVNLVSLVCVLR